MHIEPVTTGRPAIGDCYYVHANPGFEREANRSVSDLRPREMCT